MNLNTKYKIYTKINRITSPIRQFIYGIQNLIHWFKIIWKDRDWDYYYFYCIMEFKIQSMYKYYGQKGRLNKKRLYKLKVCNLLLRKLKEDNYIFNLYELHERKYGKFKLVSSDIPNSKNKKITIVNENITPENEEQERKDFSLLVDKEVYLRKQDQELLYKLLSKHIRTWQD